MATMKPGTGWIELDGAIIEVADVEIDDEPPDDREVPLEASFDMAGWFVEAYYTHLPTPGTSRRDRRKAKALARRARR